MLDESTPKGPPAQEKRKPKRRRRGRKRAYVAPFFADGSARRKIFGVYDGIPAHVPVLFRPFLTVLAGVTPRLVREKMKTEIVPVVEREEVTLSFVNIADTAKKLSAVSHIGPFACKFLLLAIAAFTARDRHMDNFMLASSCLTFSIPVWDAAEFFGLDLSLEHPAGEDGALDPRDYERLAPVLNKFQDKVKEAIDLLWRIEMPVKVRVDLRELKMRDDTLVLNSKTRIISRKSEVKGGVISIQFSQDMGTFLAHSPISQIPSAIFRIGNRERTAYALALKISAFFSIAKNHAGGRVPDRLKIRSLLLDSPLPIAEVKDPKKRLAWESHIKAPLERALDILSGMYTPSDESVAFDDETEELAAEPPAIEILGAPPGTPLPPALNGKDKAQLHVLEGWDYVGPGGAEMSRDEATYLSLEEWMEALVKFRLMDPPKIVPPKRRRGRPKKSENPEK